ncbi:MULTISPECIES: type-F conjugative transfer system pilin assembly thiol-disulfide isomerase TrbB [unclassified Providencia]|uniref:type-F conjugative transfer system pilin assembly thiol-disulfide isomerase TrbB n=1 Tax=unclassified Providencia TaxID=2633465 RepID=UPI002349D0FA|nr:MULTISPECIES: type-F conjugative transfer system pilin assembly thiol-disulfide isomerase TrbB [unclassified Providencia]
MRALLFSFLLFSFSVAQASVMDEIASLESHKMEANSQSHIGTEASEAETVIPAKPPVKPYSLPNGNVVNLNDYTLVLFMQSSCPYCHQFDPQLALLSAQTGLSVFPYTLDGKGDMAFPNAIPAPPEVVQSFFGTELQVITPTVFLVDVNTLRTYPLLQGLTDMQDVMNRVNSNLMLAIQ